MASHQQGFVYSFWKHRLAISMEPDTILDLRRQWPVGAHLVLKKWSAHNVMKKNGNIRLRTRSKSSMLCFEQQKEWLVDVFLRVCPPFFVLFWDRSLTKSSQIQLQWLTSTLQGSSSVSSIGITSTYYHAQLLCGCWGPNKLRSSSLYGKRSANWILSLCHPHCDFVLF